MQKPLSNFDLKKILETTNERDLFIVGHIYIENTIDGILEKRFNIPSKMLDDTRFFTSLKIDILAESGLIKENIKKNIEDRLKPEFEGQFKIMLVPNITNICYGRGVGYKIEEIVLDEETQKISATKIRAKMREEGKLK